MNRVHSTIYRRGIELAHFLPVDIAFLVVLMKKGGIQKPLQWRVWNRDKIVEPLMPSLNYIVSQPFPVDDVSVLVPY